MISKILAASYLCTLALAMGCNDPSVSTADSAVPNGITPIGKTSAAETSAAEVLAKKTPAVTIQTGQQSDSPPDAQEPGQPGFLDRASDLYNKSKKAGAAGNVAKQWLSDKLQDAGQSGSQSAEETAKWANEMYESLKEQGLTTAGDAGQWLTDDIRNMNAWQYKVVRMSWDNPEETEEQMNKLGKHGWECFHVADKEGRTVFFFKKSKKSYLKNIPIKDMLKLIPLMGGDDNQ